MLHKTEYMGSLAVPKDVSSDFLGANFIEFLIALLIACAGPLSIITQSYWLDEGTTLWVTAGGFGEVAERVYSTQGHSPLYFQLIWLIREFFGTSEIALRFPSFMAFALMSALLFLFIRRYSRLSAWILSALLATNLIIVQAAANARPYSISLFLSVAAIVTILSRLSIAPILFGFLVALSVLTNTFAILHVPIYFGLIFAAPSNKRNFLISLAVATTAVLLLLAQQLLYLNSVAGIGTPVRFSLIDGAFYFLVRKDVTLFSICAIFIILNKSGNFIADQKLRHYLALFLLSTIPYFALITISEVTGSSISYDRYYAFGTLIGHIALALVLPNIAPLSIRYLLLVLLLSAASMPLIQGERPYQEDYRSAANFLIDSSEYTEKIFLLSGLAQSKEIFRYDNAEQRAFLASPLTHYYAKPFEVLPGYYEEPTIRDFTLRKINESNGRWFLVGRAQEMYHFRAEILPKLKECKEGEVKKSFLVVQVISLEC